MALAEQDRFTIENYKVQTFSDFVDSFALNPMTGYVGMVMNEDSVKQSIKNLLLTERTERFYRPWIGSKIKTLLFEPFGPITEQMLTDTITETIKNCEPRANLLGVQVSGNEAINAYLINVAFSILTLPGQTFNVSIVMRRVR